MRRLPHELEYRVLQLAEAAVQGRMPADAHAACYRTWHGPPRTAARRLAAHANAARGRDLLWIIGLDAARQGNGAAPGADPARFDGWLSSLLPFFDSLAPHVTAFNVPCGSKSGKPLIALRIETGRAPFVINGKGLSPAEVPWVDAQSGVVRSAGRLDLVQLLSPLQDLPQFEMLEGELTFYRNPHVSSASKATFRWSFDASVYVMPRAGQPLVIPLHRCRGTIAISGSGFQEQATDLSLTADRNSPAVRITESAALIEGLGRFFVYGCGSTCDPQPAWDHAATVLLDMKPAGMDRAATVVGELRHAPPTESNQAGRWKL